MTEQKAKLAHAKALVAKGMTTPAELQKALKKKFGSGEK